MTNKLIELKEILIEEEVRKDLEFTSKDREKVLNSIHQPIKQNRKINAPVVIASSLSVALIFLLVMSSTPTERKNTGHEEQIEFVDQTNLFTELNQTVENNGIKVTLQKVMYDGSRILVEYGAESTTGEELERVTGHYRLTVNGEKGKDLTLSPQEGDEKDTAIVAIELYKEFPEQFDLGFNINKIEEQQGTWNFSIPVQQVPGKIKRFEPKTVVKKDHLQLSINEVIASQSAIKIRYEESGNGNIDRSSPLYNKSVIYEILDPKGNEIVPISSRGLRLDWISYGNGKHSTTTWYHAPKELPEYLVLKAYIPKQESQSISIKKSINESLPIVLNQDATNKLVISKIEKKEGQVWLHYSIDGNLKQARNWLSLKLEKDGEEQYFQPISYPDYKPNQENIAKFDVNFSENLYIVTEKISFEEFEELDMKIPLTDPQ
ncbi:DUF4179 domain-containing protein [Metabacillus endolithicus]|uniref:DUF4179 domain-containing protein n=1 Tax=Metabacillus endolithicus TaxID=1535204 RepID=A0ABW5C1B1_9BACI|nr:DUF4179 domain-containing protein [Metabacillus endolithicus]UPG63933.1 DUF4179 domain-containing protein [Metabacillus endolithicus]